MADKTFGAQVIVVDSLAAEDILGLDFLQAPSTSLIITLPGRQENLTSYGAEGK